MRLKQFQKSFTCARASVWGKSVKYYFHVSFHFRFNFILVVLHLAVAPKWSLHRIVSIFTACLCARLFCSVFSGPHTSLTNHSAVLRVFRRSRVMTEDPTCRWLTGTGPRNIVSVSGMQHQLTNNTTLFIPMQTHLTQSHYLTIAACIRSAFSSLRQPMGMGFKTATGLAHGGTQFATLSL